MKKNKKININRKNEDLSEIKTLIIITVVIVIIAVGLYFLTEFALNKKNKPTITEPAISYSETIIGEMFDKPDHEYYIFAYSSDDDNAGQYQALISTYQAKEVALPLYYIDLSKKFNSGALNEIVNKKPTKASEVAINEVALILIKNGKVTKYFETIAEFEKTLN